MEKSISTTQLEEAIQLLKKQQAYNWQLLIKQFHLTYKSLKPASLLKSTISEVASSKFLRDNILGVSLGLATGYLSKKIIVAGSENKFRKLLGSIFQFSVTNLLTKNPEAIKTLAQFIFHRILHKKERISQVPDAKTEL